MRRLPYRAWSSIAETIMEHLSQDLEHVLHHTEDLWAEMRGERIFVTGGTGFVGSWLLESLLWANRRMNLGVQCSVLTRDPAAFIARRPHLACDGAVTLHAGDVQSFRFPDGRFSYVIHGAVDASEKLNREDPTTMLETIVDGARHTLKFAETAGACRLLLISSGAVYGQQPRALSYLPETYLGGPDPMDPRAAYAEGKRLAELLCKLHSRRSGLDCLIARCFAFVGPYLPLDVHFAIGNFIRDCINRRPIEIRGDGTPVRSYLYAADLAIWLWTILLRGESCRPYNVGSEQEVSIRDLAAAVTSAVGTRNSSTLALEPRPGVLPERYVPSTERARHELGLRQWVNLHQAIQQTAEWHGTPAIASGAAL